MRQPMLRGKEAIVSVFENLETLGWKEVGVFVRIFKKKIDSVENKISSDNNK